MSVGVKELKEIGRLANFPKPWVKRAEPIHIEETRSWWVTDRCKCGRRWGIGKDSFSRMPQIVFGTEDEVKQLWRDVSGLGRVVVCEDCGADEPGDSAARLMYIPPPRSEP